MEEIFVEFPADTRYLHLATSLCRVLCEVLRHEEVDKRTIEDLELCVSEACTNAILHGAGGDSVGRVSLRFQVGIDLVILQVGDQGKGFDIERIPHPDLENPPERGLGLYIIRSKMDEVKYIRGAAGNYLEMRKFFRRK
jgi:serine/threonine-protein kinase RsbW